MYFLLALLFFQGANLRTCVAVLSLKRAICIFNYCFKFLSSHLYWGFIFQLYHSVLFAFSKVRYIHYFLTQSYDFEFLWPDIDWRESENLNDFIILSFLKGILYIFACHTIASSRCKVAYVCEPLL